MKDNSVAIQNASRSLDWKDNGKTLRCVANHIALDKPLESTLELNVECKLSVSKYLAISLILALFRKVFELFIGFFILYICFILFVLSLLSFSVLSSLSLSLSFVL